MSSSLEESIRRESGGREPSQVDRLCLDQAKAGDGLALLAPFTELISLSIQDADISSLDSLPALNRLNTLKLNDNKIKGGLQNLERLPELQKLYLASNKVQSLECLQPLAKLTKLEWLDLEGNPVAKLDGYSQLVWDLLPSLVVLDGKNRDGQELEENEDDDESEEDEDENNEDGENHYAPASHSASYPDGPVVCTAAEGDEEEDDVEGEEVIAMPVCKTYLNSTFGNT
jgi:acidic leucine-rich nuclear phosphoprotein 32 family protein A/C/D